MNHCAECRFWGFPDDDGNERACQIMSDWPYFQGEHPLSDEERHKPDHPFVGPFAGADGATFATPATFGCVLWETRPGRSGAPVSFGVQLVDGSIVQATIDRKSSGA